MLQLPETAAARASRARADSSYRRTPGLQPPPLLAKRGLDPGATGEARKLRPQGSNPEAPDKTVAKVGFADSDPDQAQARCGDPAAGRPRALMRAPRRRRKRSALGAAHVDEQAKRHTQQSRRLLARRESGEQAMLGSFLSFSASGGPHQAPGLSTTCSGGKASPGEDVQTSWGHQHRSLPPSLLCPPPLSLPPFSCSGALVSIIIASVTTVVPRRRPV
ncbi:unnamed protein product [Prorocentrum cordatum]|uniref:Uncharacterized protein n=1 Tax=Prorocentrum cordatum TaxID=2364126 RepID=A0ABN9R6U7_9DINO|nr:unnamed protein product [Polarella glacialis]